MTDAGVERQAFGSGAVAALGTAGAYRSVLVTAVRNEAPFLLEWVAYHKLIGFSQIVVLSNTSDDGTEEILAALAAAGEITHYHVDPVTGQSPQYAARIVFDEREGYRDRTWYLWLDADEFLNIHVGQRRLPDLLAAVDAVEGIHLNWRIFGSSGHKRHPGRYVSRDFPGASRRIFPPNRETKSLFRKSDKVIGFALKPSRRPRLAADHGLSASDFLGGNGRPLGSEASVTQKWFAGDKSIRTNILLPSETGWTLAQINHYSVRTPEFYALKAARGRGAGRIGGKFEVRHTDEYFASHDQNVQTDLTIAVWEPAVTAEIALLSAIPEVARAKDLSDRLVKTILAVAEAAAGAMTRPVAGAGAEPDAADGQDPGSDKPDAVQIADTGPGSDLDLAFPAPERALVERHYRAATCILEYGSGGSTLFAARAGVQVVSVESDKARAAQLASALAGVSPQAQVHHVDIGPTDAAGMPAKRRFYTRFHHYPLSVWDRERFHQPDLVLIDGCFRAACLAAVMLRAIRPTTVLIDDYLDRPHYHAVERLARKEEVVGRMARFTVTPGPIPPDMLTEVTGWFADAR